MHHDSILHTTSYRIKDQMYDHGPIGFSRGWCFWRGSWVLRSFPLCSCGVGLRQSRMAIWREETPKMGFPLPVVPYLVENLSGLKIFRSLSFIDRELPLFLFYFLSIFDRESFLFFLFYFFFSWFFSIFWQFHFSYYSPARYHSKKNILPTCRRLP